MNGLAKAGVIGAAIGMGKGIVDQRAAQRHDPYASGKIQHYALNGFTNAATLGLMAMGGFASFNSLRKSGVTIKGQTIDEIAQSIAGSKYAQALYPGKEQLINELNQTIASNTRLASSIMQENVQKPVGSVLNNQVGFDAEEAAKIAKKIKPKSYEADIDNLRNTLAQKISNEDELNSTIDKLKKVTEATINKEKKNGVKVNSIQDKLMKYPQAYFMSPHKGVNNARIATAIGAGATAYTGLAVGGRYLSGGTLTTDSYGRKDIAGIPLI